MATQRRFYKKELSVMRPMHGLVIFVKHSQQITNIVEIKLLKIIITPMYVKHDKNINNNVVIV